MSESSFALAAQATATGSKSFYFATRFFPAQMAKHAHAVYWFCRTTDDIVDEAESLESGTLALDAWESQLRAGLAGEPTDNPILNLFLQVQKQCQIPAEYPLELIAGCRMDLEQQRYDTFAELRLFCYRVASIVGLMMCHVIGFTRPEDEEAGKKYATQLGIAMQLTNILRDVGADLKLGRIYFPGEDLRAFQYSEADLAAHTHNDAFRYLMKHEAQRARAYYASAKPGIALLRPEGRFAVEIAARVYEGILREIENADYNVFNRRAVVPGWEKYWITGKAIGASWLDRIIGGNR